MMSRMRKMMITCYDASVMVSKGEVSKLGIRDKINLQMHLMGCKNCRRIMNQLNIINRNIENSKKNIEKGKIKYHLTANEKTAIQRVITKNLKSRS